MTKPKLVSQCPAGGAHHMMMYWKNSRYMGKCKNCGLPGEYDATLGLGRTPNQTHLDGTLEARRKS